MLIMYWTLVSRCKSWNLFHPEFWILPVNICKHVHEDGDEGGVSMCTLKCYMKGGKCSSLVCMHTFMYLPNLCVCLCVWVFLDLHTWWIKLSEQTVGLPDACFLLPLQLNQRQTPSWSQDVYVMYFTLVPSYSACLNFDHRVMNISFEARGECESRPADTWYSCLRAASCF